LDAQHLRRRQLILAGLFFLVIAALGWGFIDRWRHTRQVLRQQEEKRLKEREEDWFELPAKVSQGFTGSATCAECHAEIAAKFARHPMGRSFARVTDAEPIENYEDTEFAPPGPRRYRVERDGDQVYHHERMVDEAGQTIYDQRVPIRYALGSGQHGRSYLIEKEGHLWQSSIGWFTAGETWGLSPGYRPEFHQRFERRVDASCLYCHVGRVNLLEDGSDRFAAEPFAELSIGCERCHGPGEAHVAHQQASRKTGRDDTIVNPGRLEPRLREAVCNQCHLQGERTLTRYGRGFFDFRPGEPLEDCLLIMVEGERVDERGQTRPVSQVEQMRSSACFQKSAGKLGCISCHDPHESPAAESRADYYRSRCLECHTDRGCSLPVVEQSAAPAQGSCVHCHMPKLETKDVAHTSLTDHRVMKKPDQTPPPQAEVPWDELKLFDGAEDRLAAREVRRARAIMLLERAERRRDNVQAARVHDLLVPRWLPEDDIDSIANLLGYDQAALGSLGQAFQIMDQRALSVKSWSEALRVHPNAEPILARMADLYQEDKNWKEALKYFDRALEINPHSSIYQGRRAYVLGNLGRLEEGVAAAVRALEIDPTLTQVREWLVDVYGRLGKAELRAEQQQLLERTNQALKVRPAGRS
jgi:predicted CXXCH cytochrome family protein